MNKIFFYLIILSLFANSVSAYTRVFYEDYEDTSFATTFVEDNYGSSYSSFWNILVDDAHQSSTPHTGTYSMSWNPIVDLNIYSQFGMGSVTYGNLDDIDFTVISNRYWYIRWYQRWNDDTYTGQNKILYIGCGGDYYYIAKSSNGSSFQYVIRDEFGGDILEIGYPSHSSSLDDGEWHKLEVFIDFGSSNEASDGDTWMKIDDETLFTETGLNFVTLPTPMGCVALPGNTGLAEQRTGSQDVFIDDVEVYTLTDGNDIPPEIGGNDPVVIMNNSGLMVDSTPLATITGTATADSGRTIDGVTSPGLSVVCDDGTWDEQEETFTVTSVSLDEGLNTFTFTAEDDQTDTGEIDFTVTLDTIDPVVTAFVIPSTSDSLTVSITTFTASDAGGVAAYLVNESASEPSLSDSNWQSSAQTQYIFGSEGAKTLYAWVKDEVDHISSSLNDSVTITLVGEPECDADHYWLCLTQSPCEAEGFYWWDNACRTIAEPSDWSGSNLLSNPDLENWSDGLPDDWNSYFPVNVTEQSTGVQLENQGDIRQSFLEDGKTYRYAANIITVVEGNFEIYHYDDNDLHNTIGTITGQFTMGVVPDHNIYFKAPSGNNDVTVNNFVVREKSDQSSVSIKAGTTGQIKTGTTGSLGN